MRFPVDEASKIESKVKGDEVHMTEFFLRRKQETYKISIPEYLAEDSEWDRRQYLFNQDVFLVKTHQDVPGMSFYLDTAHKSITHALKEADLFTLTFADQINNRSL